MLASPMWNNFIAEYQPTQFLQSAEWAEFQKSLGRFCYQLIGDWGQSLVVKYQLPLQKNYLYCPRGPILTQTDADPTRTNAENFFREITNLAKKEKSIFLRFEPPIIGNWELGIGNYRRAVDVQPSKTTILDLSKSEDELLAAMHYKTRYNIHLAEKHGVKIREGNAPEIEKFLDLLHQTSHRDRFQSHPDNYYRKLINLQTYKLTNLYLAEYQGMVLAANLMIFFGDTVTYLHGASANELKNLMAPHLLQWEVIKAAKQKGYHFYDFWGIDEKKWPGVTRFKMGFGGKEVQYPGTFDLTFDKFWYQLYCFGKIFKKF